MLPYYAQPKHIQCLFLGNTLLNQHSGDFRFSKKFLINCINIFLPEPVGSVSPKINANEENIKILRAPLNQATKLLCPAQAYPVPIFRYEIPITFKSFRLKEDFILK